jgi:hypothetical protein
MKLLQYQKNYHELTTDEAKRLVKIIKNCTEQSGVLIFQQIHKTHYREVNKRRRAPIPTFGRVQYQWLPNFEAI